MNRRRPPRLPAAIYVGVKAYFLTICCDERRTTLLQEAARDVVMFELRRTSDDHHFAVFAYCLMPDHRHLVAEGCADSSNCTTFARVFKQRSAFAWKQRVGERLWQPGFYDHVLRDAEHMRSIVRYVLENPVRGHLVTSPQDYVHSGSLVYERDDLFAWAFDKAV